MSRDGGRGASGAVEVDRSPSAQRGSRLAALLWTLAAGTLALLGVRTFFADLYRVSSSSMEPTVFGGPEAGETVLVRYTAAPVRRFDLVVVQRAGEDDPVVKRVAGLPGETVSLVGGDLVVDGARLPPDEPRPPAIPVFDSALRPVEDAFHFKRAPGGPWSPGTDGAWEVDGREVEPGSSRGMMLFSPDVRDTYRHPSGEVRGGLHQVGDVVLELEARCADEDGSLRLLLVEEGDTFEARIAPRPGGLARAALQRWVSGAPDEVLAESELAWRPGAWHAVRFANVDNALVLEVTGPGGADALRLTCTYAANEPYPGRTQGGDLSVGARAGFGAEGARAGFRSVRVLRDLHYTARGTFGVERPLTLGLGELYLLGDNSGDSRDSRFWGPVPAAEVVGRAAAVVWPLARRRWLAPRAR